MSHQYLLSGLIIVALTFMPSHGNATSSKTKGEDANKNGKLNSLAKASRVPNYSREGEKPPPQIKITPLQGGKYMLEPLNAPPKTISPSSSRPGKDDPRNISALSEALTDHPVRYARGGSLETGVATDCSGFTQFIFHHGFSVNLPRSSIEQAQVGQTVTRKMDFTKLLPGDLLLFSDEDRPVGHAGIYLGKGLMIHASSKRGKVVITDIRQGYYFENFVVAKRFLEESRPRPAALPRPRVFVDNHSSPGLPPPALFSPISRIMPVVAAKMGGLFKLCWPWEYQGFRTSS